MEPLVEAAIRIRRPWRDGKPAAVPFLGGGSRCSGSYAINAPFLNALPQTEWELERLAQVTGRQIEGRYIHHSGVSAPSVTIFLVS